MSQSLKVLIMKGKPTRWKKKYYGNINHENINSLKDEQNIFNVRFKLVHEFM